MIKGHKLKRNLLKTEIIDKMKSIKFFFIINMKNLNKLLILLTNIINNQTVNFKLTYKITEKY